MGHGRLRASDADREQVIETLKAAFVQGWLTRDQLGARAGQALRSRTYADLAAATDGIPARRPAPQGHPRSRWDAPGSRWARRWLRGPRACLSRSVLGAAFLTYYGGFVVLFLLAFTGLTATSKR